MERVDELIEIITNFLSQVGSNMGVIERGSQMVELKRLRHRIGHFKSIRCFASRRSTQSGEVRNTHKRKHQHAGAGKKHPAGCDAHHARLE